MIWVTGGNREILKSRGYTKNEIKNLKKSKKSFTKKIKKKK